MSGGATENLSSVSLATRCLAASDGAQARAVDNQLFVLTCSPARSAEASYQVRHGGRRREGLLEQWACINAPHHAFARVITKPPRQEQ